MAKAGRKKGYTVSEKTKAKISKSRTGKFQSVETKEKIANSLLIHFKEIKPLSDDLMKLYTGETCWIEKHRCVINDFDDVKTQSRLRSINQMELSVSHFIEEIAIDYDDPETLLLRKEEGLMYPWFK